MLYYLFSPFEKGLLPFHLFRYITFRGALAAVIAFLICVIFGPRFIARLKAKQLIDDVSEPDSEKLDELRHGKEGTPTMGGLLIIGSVVLTTLICADLRNFYIILVLFTTIALCSLGFLDDFIKLHQGTSQGMSGKAKLFFQFVLGLMLGAIITKHVAGQANATAITFPFFKNLAIDLGPFFILWVALVLAATSNAVNLTDGLDGLAAGCVVMAALAFAALSYVVGRYDFSRYLQLHYIEQSGELTIFCAAVAGACLGFLWFNCYPAQIFMGDTGSLPLGGAIGTVAVILKQELMLLIVGGVFVAEALSVILQVLWFKRTGRRVFLCAPLHHHFQFKGWPEMKVVVRFWIAAALLAVLGLATLKVR